MSTKVGIIAEGPIDHALLPPLLSRIAALRAEFTWPVFPDDLSERLAIRSRGHGGVLLTIQRLVNVLDEPESQTEFDHACFVILLDRRTRTVQDQLAGLIRGRDRFVTGIAREEIEAWWLGDRINTLNWADLRDRLPGQVRYAAPGYHAERDDAPKRTLS